MWSLVWTLLKSVGSWLIPIIIKEFVDEFLAKRNEIKEQKDEQAKDQKDTEELVKESQGKEGMTDEELLKAQESAWKRFINKFKS